MTEADARRWRLAILDDHILIVDGLAKWVQINAHDFEVVAAVGRWASLMEKFPTGPDVIIMAQKLDEPVPVVFRIEQCLQAGAKVVIMSSVDSVALRNEALDAGASAFIAKSRPASEVVSAARWALDPEAICDLEPESLRRPASPLDEQDLAIVRLYASGHSTVDISLVLGIKFETVRTSLKRIRELYKAQGRVAVTRDDLLRRAAEDGHLAE